MGALVALYNDFSCVYLSLGITAGIVVTVTLLSMFCGVDLTGFGGFFLMAGVGLLVTGGIFLIVILFEPITYTPLMLALSVLGVLVFTGYLAYDTQILIGGDHKMALDPEEYIMGAIQIYLDIINIFLYVLRFVGAARSD